MVHLFDGTALGPGDGVGAGGEVRLAAHDAADVAVLARVLVIPSPVAATLMKSSLVAIQT